MRARYCLAAAVVIALAACAIPATPPPPASETAREISERSLEHDGRMRRFLLHDYSGDAPAPLVILLHGGGGHAENAVAMTNFDRIAAREGLIAAYPDGSGGTPGGRLLTWNAGDCCAYAMNNAIDDVGFLSAIIDALVSEGRVDPARVYVTGMSNGAMMSHRFAREASSKVTGIAPVVGALFGGEPPPEGPVPAFIIVGAEDRVVPGAGGAIGGEPDRLIGSLARRPANRPAAPALAQADYWTAANGCTGPPTEALLADGSRSLHWAGCSSGAAVVFETVASNGHAWPGGRAGRAEADQPTPDYDASERMWAFFARQVRSSP